MKEELSTTIKRIAILLAGLVIAHLGVTLFLLADLGADPFNVLVQGLCRTAGGAAGMSFLTHGMTHIAVSLLIIIVLLFVDRSYIKIGTIICMICGGPIIDLFTRLLSPLLQEPAMAVKLMVNCLGCVILAFGMTIVIKSDAGTGPNDLVALVISDKSGKKFGLVRAAVDLSFVLAGYLLGGSVGIGTIICAFLVGPVAGFFMPISQRITERIVRPGKG